MWSIRGKKAVSEIKKTTHRDVNKKGLITSLTRGTGQTNEPVGHMGRTLTLSQRGISHEKGNG